MADAGVDRLPFSRSGHAPCVRSAPGPAVGWSLGVEGVWSVYRRAPPNRCSLDQALPHARSGGWLAQAWVPVYFGKCLGWTIRSRRRLAMNARQPSALRLGAFLVSGTLVAMCSANGGGGARDGGLPDVEIGMTCTRNEDCVAGLCYHGICGPCPSWMGTYCAGACRDIQSDAANCGSCGHVCDSGGRCTAGVCVCPGTMGMSCSGVCRDLASDGANCGSCGNACASGGTCAAGRCTCPGVMGTVCDGVCRDLATDPANCGSCGHACPAACSSGACTSVAEISASGEHTCARLIDGSVRCWGANFRGELGDGTRTDRHVPTTVIF
jgi:hypothetical protein